MESHAQPFHEALAHWEAFYLMAGTAAVTLVGLLFVALSMHVAVLFRGEHARTREMAFQAFQGYLYVLVTALVFLAPPLSARTLGATYLLMNLVLLLRTVLRVRRFATKGDGAWGLGMPIVGSGIGIALGAVIWSAGIPAGNLLLLPPLIVLASATRTAWALLENVARIEGGRRDEEGAAALVGREQVE